MFLKSITLLAFLTFFMVVTAIGCQWPVGLFIKYAISQVPFGDKSLHFLLLAVLSLLLNGCMEQRRTNIWGTQVLVGSLLVGAGITLEECSQAFIPSRNFEFLDMVCNYAGIYAGSMAGFILPPNRNKQESDASDRNKTLSV
ncbi:MAG: VanZ family protein [Lewinellaceae bacterium]|nr:VanZ family protein [Saprospiraceae bacterium]MCB9339084.1 VanZ family protein [Lewinellaceae bacterium]